MLRSWSRAHAPGLPGRGPKAHRGQRIHLEEGPKIVPGPGPDQLWRALQPHYGPPALREGPLPPKPPGSNGPAHGPEPALWLPDPSHSIEAQQPWGEALKAAFPSASGWPWDALTGGHIWRYHQAYAPGQALALPLTAAGDERLVTPEDKPLHDVLTAIRLGRPVASLGSALHSNGERHLQPWATLQRRYAPELLAETLRIADRCHFSLAQLRYEYPEELVPPGQTPSSHLRSLTFAGAAQRWRHSRQRDPAA